jgi:hypothetical protein
MLTGKSSSGSIAVITGHRARHSKNLTGGLVVPTSGIPAISHADLPFAQVAVRL